MNCSPSTDRVDESLSGSKADHLLNADPSGILRMIGCLDTSGDSSPAVHSKSRHHEKGRREAYDECRKCSSVAIAHGSDLGSKAVDDLGGRRAYPTLTYPKKSEALVGNETCDADGDR